MKGHTGIVIHRISSLQRSDLRSMRIRFFTSTTKGTAMKKLLTILVIAGMTLGIAL